MSYVQEIDCVNNAYRYLLGIREGGKDGKVIFVYDPPHAYVSVAGLILNKGVTFGDGSYPDYSTEEIKSLLRTGRAEDVTQSLDYAYRSGGEVKYSVGGRLYP